jgi:hypothetical protein
MPKISRHNLASLAVALLALPVVMGPGRCGFVLDYTETMLITDEIDRVVLGVDDGSVVATMYDREATLLKRHTFTFEPSLETVSDEVEDGVLTLEARCKYEGNCRFDHMLELPLGIAIDITMLDSQISLGYIDSDIDVKFESGWFKGVRLASPNFDLSLTTGDVTVDFAAPPASVTIAVEEGDVAVELPAGAYRCALEAGGAVENDGITCDDAAPALLDIKVRAGDITVTGI